MNIYYLSSNPLLIESLESNFECQDTVSWVDLRTVNEYSVVEYVLIVSPVQINCQWVIYDQLWYHFLSKKNPKAKIAILSFDKSLNSSEFDFFSLPEHPTHLFSTKNQYFDSFKNKKTLRHIDIEQKIQRFFAGHGKKSVMEVLYVLMRKLNLVERELRIGEWPIEKIFNEYIGSDYTDRKWNEFKLRWDDYFPFFEYSPFFQLFKEIDAEIKDLSPFFDTKSEKKELYWDLKSPKKLRSICNKLVKIRDESGVIFNNSALIIQ